MKIYGEVATKSKKNKKKCSIDSFPYSFEQFWWKPYIFWWKHAKLLTNQEIVKETIEKIEINVFLKEIIGKIEKIVKK